MTAPAFRLGAPSFVRADTWLGNVDWLTGCFPELRDIEILFFDGSSQSFPGKAELAALAERKKTHELTYTLHTPLEASLASEDEARRRTSVATVARAIEVARPLAPEAHVVHVYLGDGEHDARRPSDLAAWRRRATRSLRALAALVGARGLCVESIDYPFELIEPVIHDLGLSVALDVGHWHRDGMSIEQQVEIVNRNLHRTRVVQWHGTDPSGRDHRSLRHFPEDRSRALLEALVERGYQGVLTLEVFRESDLVESLEVVRSLLAESVA